MTVAVLAAALATGLYMAWNIGANDVANAMGTSVGSGALTLKGAILVAAVFEFGGAVLVGSHVSETIRAGILDPELFEVTGMFGPEGPLLLALGMTGSLLAAAVWLQVATSFGLPVSTTHSIVGAVVGFGLTAVGLDGIDLTKIAQIMASWVVSPMLGALLGFLVFVLIRRHILRKPDPVRITVRVAPHLVGLVGTILTLSFIYKVLPNVLPDPHPALTLIAALGVGGVSAVVAHQVVVYPAVALDGDSEKLRYVERIFAGLQIVTAAFVAFAHGSNDVANAVGPLAAVFQIAGAGFREVPAAVPVPGWLLAAGGVGIVVGLATYGYKVIRTIGRHITELTPTRGFSAEFGAASTVLVASLLGLPISTTHTLVGAVIGVGMAHGLAALNLRTVGKILNSWIATVPAAAVLSALFFVLLRALFL